MLQVVGLLLLIGAFGLFEWELAHGEPEAKARTSAVNVFVFGELFYLFNCRSLTQSIFVVGPFSNRWVVAGALAGVFLVLIATMATIIASQAVITGAYSITQQAIQLGILPRMEIRRTSETQAGQIYMPQVNWALMVATIGLVVGFIAMSIYLPLFSIYDFL